MVPLVSEKGRQVRTWSFSVGQKVCTWKRGTWVRLFRVLGLAMSSSSLFPIVVHVFGLEVSLTTTESGAILVRQSVILARPHTTLNH